MTFKEKWELEHNAVFTDCCYGNICPSEYGYEKRRADEWCYNVSCVRCWNRQIPEEENIEEKEVCSINPKVFVINGMATSGKSTFVSLCKKYNKNVYEVSTVDFVKEVAKYAGWGGTKDEKGRKLLSDIKDALEEYDNIPNKKIDEFIQSHPNSIIFVNAREPKNIAYYKAKYNALSIIIKNQNVPNLTSNHADAEVNNFQYDIIINNNQGLEELEKKAKTLMQSKHIQEAINHYEYGITHDIFSEPVVTYAKLAIEALKRMQE